jgi:cyclophilin family peptidyl-prolyl cis-trans isomerase
VSPSKRSRQKDGSSRVEAAQAERRKADRQRRLILVGGTVTAAIVLIALVLLIVVHQTSDSTEATDTTVRPTTAADYGKGPCPRGDGSSPRTTAFTSAPKLCIDPAGHYSATFDTSVGEFIVSLDAARAPVTVNNFVVLAESHFYDGTFFQRAIPDYLIQGGDQTGDTPNKGNPGYHIADELPHSVSDYLPGAMAMASDRPNTGGSQFIVWVGPTKLSSAKYPLFGRVTSGMSVVKNIAAGGSASGVPAAPVKISSVTIGEAQITSR